MDPNSNPVLTACECGFGIVALVSWLRSKFHWLEGWVVLVLAMAVGVVFALFTAPEDTVFTREITKGLLLGLAAAGVMAGIKYHADKTAVAAVAAATMAVSIRPPPRVAGPVSVAREGERGYAIPWFLYGIVFVALVVALGLAVLVWFPVARR